MRMTNIYIYETIVGRYIISVLVIYNVVEKVANDSQQLYISEAKVSVLQSAHI